MTIQRMLLALALASPPAAFVAQTAAPADIDVRKVDAVFAKYTAGTPGCAVGVARGGSPVLARGYGAADLEHDVPIAADTIFEAGSVSKQFTAAAVLLLARDGKLSLDDPVRTYVPELPDYGRPLLIRHMLTHTSGLRDWGSVAGIGGWPRTSRAYTHAHVLEIVSRQRELNFAPGTRWSYSNTGFNLAAIIVSRVSGRTFQDFSRERLFAPLGMTHTSWRDDYTRVLKGRAIAYTERGGEVHTLMPFENVYGNGGLLTTVGDLLKWNENFATPVVGDAAFVAAEQRRGTFSDGRAHGYGLGLFVGTRQQVREVYHSGSTAGYSAFLTRFPDQRLSVAVLCNVATNATQLAHGVADLYLGIQAPPPARTVTDADIDAHAGAYRSAVTGQMVVVSRENEPALRGRTWTFDGHGGAAASDEFGTIEAYERVEPAHPAAADLAAYEGRFDSDEAEVAFTAVVENGTLVLKRRPDTTLRLTPLYADAFSAPQLGTVIFRRDAAGRIASFDISQERVWKLTVRKVG